MPDLTEKQLDSLRHMLGINDPSKCAPKPYRNYAAVEPGDSHWPELERLGLVERFECRFNSGYHWYRATAAGIAAATGKAATDSPPGPTIHDREKHETLRAIAFDDCMHDAFYVTDFRKQLVELWLQDMTTMDLANTICSDPREWPELLPFNPETGEPWPDNPDPETTT